MGYNLHRLAPFSSFKTRILILVLRHLKRGGIKSKGGKSVSLAAFLHV